MEKIFISLKNFIKSLFHRHKWKIIKDQQISVWGSAGEKYPVKKYLNYILQCEECGRLKHEKYELH